MVKLGRIETLSRKNVNSEVPCHMAIEVNAGVFEAEGVKVGDHVKLGSDTYEGTVALIENDEGKERRNQEFSKMASLKEAAWWNPLDWFRKRKKNNPQQVVIPSQSPWNFPQGSPEPENSVEPDSPLPEEESVADESSNLPEVGLDDIQYADDDVQEEPSEPIEYDENGNPVKPEPEEGEEDIPDASSMTTAEAIDLAIQEGYVMWINYLTKPVKRTIGPPKGNIQVLRIVQPHGVLHARTTGNNVLVTWDLTVNDYRAFIVDRISDKAFTGQKFKRWFAVRA